MRELFKNHWLKLTEIITTVILKIISTSFPSPPHTSVILKDFQIVTFSRYMSILVVLYSMLFLVYMKVQEIIE